ncbi:hypothetical protein, partial [Burkholderia cenocepacia]|uniref:hypothetical protein n=1 Tax=Burkholderia cenocepacia TaxID=95486 RepID=UPI002AB7196C
KAGVFAFQRSKSMRRSAVITRRYERQIRLSALLLPSLPRNETTRFDTIELSSMRVSSTFVFETRAS